MLQRYFLHTFKVWWLVCEAVMLPLSCREYFFVWAFGRDLKLLLKGDDIITDVQDRWLPFLFLDVILLTSFRVDTEISYFGKIQSPLHFMFHSVPSLPLYIEKSWTDKKLTYLMYTQVELSFSFDDPYLLSDNLSYEKW